MKSIKNWLLKQVMIGVIFCLIAFFSLNVNVNAASFAYNSFNWDLFYEENSIYLDDSDVYAGSGMYCGC